ncbi:MAG: chitobiase/beta-hexosaminidase C-terminal domain-containing protein, partial [Planctomycetota bacterium]
MAHRTSTWQGCSFETSGNTYTIPDDPNALIAPSEYKLFWADNDKLPDQGPLHTNFKLGASGDDIYLFNKNGILIDSKTYNADQVADISHGRFPDNDAVWYNMDDPTPEATNTAGMAGDVWFSKLSGTFTSTFNLQLFTETPGATIRYTTDGSAPTSGSTAYSGPISITNAAARRIRARAYHATLAPGNLTSHYYIPLASDVQTFSSNLPIVVIDTYNTSVDLGVLKMASSVFIDTDRDTGIASIQDVPDHAGRIGLKRRGESSDAWPKKHYGMELWDE